MSELSWAPFELMEKGAKPLAPRSINSFEGVCDRLRAAAFAEIQAREAFRWGAENFKDAPEALKADWLRLAGEEDKHLNWLLKRLNELGGSPSERKVSIHLWESLISSASVEEFTYRMATAEDRGRQAGERFYRDLQKSDPITAEIFRKIAEEEIEHIRIAERYFPNRTALYSAQKLAPAAPKSTSTSGSLV
jgi:uncharacterized ferritin-like protein (DUF455 family)